MLDNRSDKVIETCDQYAAQSCFNCPLREPCKTLPGDTREIFDQRMNAAVEELKEGD